MIYDVAVVGAGPAGLMAAKTAAEKGLNVVVTEKRRDVSKITRACCQQFIMDDGYEDETIKVEPGKIIFPKNGFEVDYHGNTHEMTDKYYISPEGRKIHFAYKDKRPITIGFDKGLLLQGIWGKCENLGVEFRRATVAYDADDKGKWVELSLTSGGTHSTLQARKVIAADGVNSRIADALEMNKERTFFGTGLVIVYLLEGLKELEQTAWKTHMGLAYQTNGVVIIYGTFDENRAHLCLWGSKKQPPEQIYQNVTTKSPLSPLFEKVKIVEKVGAALSVFTSMKVPYRGNTLAIGDAAAMGEVETQGALMCGFRAGNAVYEELEGAKGFDQYTQWWQKSFEFNSDEALRVAQGYALVPTYSDGEIDYLFALTEDEVLEGSFSQYKTPKLMWDSILRHRDKIKQEHPDLYQKITNIKQLSIGNIL